MPNIEGPDETAVSDLGLYCLLRPVCWKTLDHYSMRKLFFLFFSLRIPPT